MRESKVPRGSNPFLRHRVQDAHINLKPVRAVKPAKRTFPCIEPRGTQVRHDPSRPILHMVAADSDSEEGQPVIRMRATIRTLRTVPLPAPNTEAIYCEARSGNDILFVFCPPSLQPVRLGDAIELDPNRLERPQIMLNVTTGVRFTSVLRQRNVRDLRLFQNTGLLSFPQPERFSAA